MTDRSITVDFASKPVRIDEEPRPGLIDAVSVEGTLVLREHGQEEDIGFIRAVSIPTQAMGTSLVAHMVHKMEFEDVAGLLMTLSEHGFHSLLRRLEIYSSHVMLVSAVGVDERYQSLGYGRAMFEWMSRVFHDPLVLLEAEPMICEGGELHNYKIGDTDIFRTIRYQRDRLHKFYKAIGLHQHDNMEHVFVGRVQRHKTRESFVREAWA
jgi:GNAT superfamily N-acetyltransferase